MLSSIVHSILIATSFIVVAPSFGEDGRLVPSDVKPTVVRELFRLDNLSKMLEFIKFNLPSVLHSDKGKFPRKHERIKRRMRSTFT